MSRASIRAISRHASATLQLTSTYFAASHYIQECSRLAAQPINTASSKESLRPRFMIPNTRSTSQHPRKAYRTRSQQHHHISPPVPDQNIELAPGWRAETRTRTLWCKPYLGSKQNVPCLYVQVGALGYTYRKKRFRT